MAEIFGLSKFLPNWVIFWISDILLMKFCSTCSSLRLYKSTRGFRETQLSRVKFAKVEAQGQLDGILHAASLVMGSFEVWSLSTVSIRFGYVDNPDCM